VRPLSGLSNMVVELGSQKRRNLSDEIVSLIECERAREEEPTSEEVEALDAEPKEYLSEGELTGLLKGNELERKPRRSSSG
jgi:hypothetical protein